ncbi:hypothetical protein Pcinc_015071 [Petrolisthes cinctipes]|uniref:DNA ligase n=1 Tax=Petrolisthes cinctipes TaxID=88211 RepID=A0AAE1FTX8_PETCI|nr:hypothetical protein Pcinc_015071 [Petrolisthes cinctipes]
MQCLVANCVVIVNVYKHCIYFTAPHAETWKSKNRLYWYHMIRGRTLLPLSRNFVPQLVGRLEVGACSSRVPRFTWTHPLPVTWDCRFQVQVAGVSCYSQPPPKCLSLILPTSSPQQPDMADFPFCVDYDKRGMAKCKKCKQKCDKGVIRIGKLVSNHFSDSGGMMKQWYHVDCLFETFKRARATTKKIDDPVDDIEGWGDLENDDQSKIQKLVDEFHSSGGSKPNTPKKTPQKKLNTQTPQKVAQQSPGTPGSQKKGSAPPAPPSAGSSRPPGTDDPPTNPSHKDNSFREFRRICAAVADEPSYTGKTEIVSSFVKYGTEKDKFKGDLRLWVKLLLPGVIKRVYNLQSKQLIKLFSQIFNTNAEEMIEDLQQGDVAETIRKYFEDESSILPPIKKCILSIQDIDGYLEKLSGMTKEEEQSILLKTIAKRCTGNDLKMVVRLIKGDLRINAGAKHILEAVHPDAYEAFQTTRNIDSVLDRLLAAGGSPVSLKLTAVVMTPVLPMLAEACKSVDYAFKKCPSGAMFAEIKYDGERVQVHKNGSDFKYFSRSLKPVLPHKVSHFKEFLPKAFPHGQDLILDAEVLMIDTKTGVPLPFGTLGVHKKAEFKDANVCLFIFDCLHYNGEDLMSKPIVKRREILEKTMTEIKHRVVLSEQRMVKAKDDLKEMISTVLKQGLEGLVLKDINSIYEPGKRHWLKVKKDYLNDGAMADTADLAVLGAWYGTGKKGGMMSVFLMGCYDPRISKWCTVTKVHTGHDDAALERLQKELDMVKISQDADRVPAWLKCTKTMIPDFVAADPKKSPIWEITGAEFTKHQVHTADGISIRFPRVTRIRDDKTWKESTDLKELKELYKKSQEHADFVGLEGSSDSKGNGGGQSPGSGRASTGNSPSSSPVTTATKVSIRASPGNRDTSGKETTKAKNTLPSYFKQEKANEGNIKKEREIKRKHSPADDVSPSKKSKKVCKYGEKCNNSNEAHQLLYEHPPARPKAPTIKPLPDIFMGTSVSLPSHIDPEGTLRRYIIAYPFNMQSLLITRVMTSVTIGDDIENQQNWHKHNLSRPRDNTKIDT